MKALVGAAIGMVLLAIFAIGSLLVGLGSNRDRTQKVTSTIREPRTEAPPAEGVVVPLEQPATQTVEIYESSSPLAPNVLMPAPGQDVTAIPGQIYSQTAPPPATAAVPPTTFPDPRQVHDTSIPPPGQSQAPGNTVTIPAPIIVEHHRARVSRTGPEPINRASRTDPEPINRASRTDPEPINQPVPAVERLLGKDGTFRARLTIGADGRVKEVDVIQPLAGATSSLIGAIQHWSFRPATEDGRAVEGTFDTELSFSAQR